MASLSPRQHNSLAGRESDSKAARNCSKLTVKLGGWNGIGSTLGVAHLSGHPGTLSDTGNIRFVLAYPGATTIFCACPALTWMFCTVWLKTIVVVAGMVRGSDWPYAAHDR